MKVELIEMIASAFKAGFDPADCPEIIIEIPKREGQGDFSCSAAMVYASKNKLKPREVAARLLEFLPKDKMIESVDIAGPGFLNFKMKKEFWHNSVRQMVELGADYGSSDIGHGQRVQVEYVSANPTGPLHIGHGRGAAIGDSLANLLKFCGYDVVKEYYINDVGNQIGMLGRSVKARLDELINGVEPEMEGLYRGDYVKELAQVMLASEPDIDSSDAFLLGSKAQARMLEEIKKDLQGFGISFDCWFSEALLHQGGQGGQGGAADSKVETALTVLEAKGALCRKDDALWVKTSELGDDKDRVVVRSNGEKTYFASDIAYHKDKFDRGFDRVINVWGADHHGYIRRVEAVCELLGYNSEALDILIVQLVRLFRGGRLVVMSKRGGEFITLKEVVDEVGKDAARFFFLMRRADTSLDFDLDLAKKESSENPVYYVQYAHARICSLMGKAAGEGFVIPGEGASFDNIKVETLVLDSEIALIKQMTLFPLVISQAALHMEPHRIAFFLVDLAGALHGYYYKQRVITDDNELTCARLVMMRCVGNIIKCGLSLIGVSAPESM